jgi:hypothetical protein
MSILRLTSAAGRRRRAAIGALGGLLIFAGVAGGLPPGAVAEQASQPAAAAAGGVDVGKDHTCALLTTGNVRCWGFGGLGALGYGNSNVIGDDETPAAAGPVALGVGRTATAVVTGDFHSCALLDDKSVRCWGFGGDGRLGYANINSIGDDEPASAAGPVDLGGPAKTISAGAGHTCAVMVNGDLRCWGYGNSGALGYGNTDSIGDNETPAAVAPVPLGTARTATAVSAGFDFTCALLDARPDLGNVRCFGQNRNGRLGLPGIGDTGNLRTPGSFPPIDLGGTATAIAAGGNHACAILAVSGSVRCWGLGLSGQLGYGNTDNIGDNETPASVAPVQLGGPAEAISAGAKHTCAILVGGSVRCWGSNRTGQLGYPNTGDVGDDETPASVGPVDLGAGRTAVAISAGAESTCARLDDGKVRCWGYGVLGRLGYCNPNTVGDDETPGSVGPVNLEAGDGGAGCGGAASAVSAPPAGAPAAPSAGTAPQPPAGAPTSTTADDGIAAEKVRAAALRSCLKAMPKAARARRLARSRCLARNGRTPGRVTTISARATGRGTILLSFEAPGTDSTKPPAARGYLIKQSTRPIRTARDFSAAQPLCKGTCSFSIQRIGAKITLTVGQLRPASRYYYAIAARDNVSGRPGPRSATVTARTG